MAKSRRKSRFLKETSARSGFDNWDFDKTTFHKRWESIKDKGTLIAPEEFDEPPLSKKSLGGADIIRSNQRPNGDTTTTPSATAEVIHYITAGGGITIPSTWSGGSRFLITGSATAVDISANPQIARGTSNQIIAIECIGSSVLLEDGNGLNLRRSFNMDSGAILNLIYKSDDNVWSEISRGHEGQTWEQ